MNDDQDLQNYLDENDGLEIPMEEVEYPQQPIPTNPSVNRPRPSRISKNSDTQATIPSRIGQKAINKYKNAKNNTAGNVGTSPTSLNKNNFLKRAANPIGIPGGLPFGKKNNDEESTESGVTEENNQNNTSEKSGGIVDKVKAAKDIGKEKVKDELKAKVGRALLKFLTKNPWVLLIVVVLFAIVALVVLVAMDFDFVGDEITEYSEAQAASQSLSGYCQNITLLLEDPDFPGKPLANIDDADLEEKWDSNGDGKKDKDRWKEIRTNTLDDYVKRVVQAEAIDVHDEKTFEVAAIAARTYAEQITSKRCLTYDNRNKRPEYHNPQNYSEEPTIDPDVEKAVSTTYGIVATVDNKLYDMSNSSYYDYFCTSDIIKSPEGPDHNIYSMLQENDEEQLELYGDWVIPNVPENDFQRSGYYYGDCQTNGISLFGAKYLLTKDAHEYTTFRIIRYYLSYDIEFKNVTQVQSSSGYSCGEYNMHDTTLSREDFIAKVNAQNFPAEFKSAAGSIYDLAKQNNFNPELVYTRAKSEGLSPGGSTYNYWGIGCKNGCSACCKRYASVIQGATAYMNLLLGYNVQTLLEVYSVKHYAYIGSNWIKGGSGSGGCYYLPYMKKYYTNMDRYNVVEQACASGNAIPTNDEDQLAYAHYNIEKDVNFRMSIFGIGSEDCDDSGPIDIGNLTGDQAAKINAILSGNDSIGVKASKIALTYDDFGYSQGSRWGPNTVDCSSLISRVYKPLGITLGGNTTVSSELNWCRNNGKLIDKSQLQPGDLLFRSDHVEMYIGNNERFGAHTASVPHADQVSRKPYNPQQSSGFTLFCRPY